MLWSSFATQESKTCVPEGRFELPRDYSRQVLSLLRLPISPLRPVATSRDTTFTGGIVFLQISQVMIVCRDIRISILEFSMMRLGFLKSEGEYHSNCLPHQFYLELCYPFFLNHKSVRLRKTTPACSHSRLRFAELSCF